jgi:hypothetical protein
MSLFGFEPNSPPNWRPSAAEGKQPIAAARPLDVIKLAVRALDEKRDETGHNRHHH